MTLIVPILFAAAAMGLLARRVTPGHWIAFAGWIALVAVYNLARH